SSALTTITSLVEREISKTLSSVDKRLSNNSIPSEKILLTSPLATMNSNVSTQPLLPPLPPPLVTLPNSHSPSIPSHPLHNQQTFSSKGSIVRGTPIS
ncbi:unnamed protein product, partial [Rotaria magnacalcarata]